MMKFLLFNLLFLFSLPAFSQIGMNRENIITLETSHRAILRSDSAKLHYFADNINTYYYFNGVSCNYIVKMTYKSAIAKLKTYLTENGFSYDAENNSYITASSRAHLIYKGIFVG